MSNTLITQFFAYTQMKQMEIFHLGELQTAWKISPKQERNLLDKLIKKKLLFD